MASENQLTPDLVFDLLSSSRRRVLLSQLRKRDGPMTVTELAKLIAASEYGTDADSLTRQQQKRVYVSLYQTHVPKMVDAGVVDYDAETGTVRPTQQVMDLDFYLDGEADVGYPWQVHYLALTILGSVFYVLWMGPVRVFGGLPPTVLGPLVLLAFGVSAVVHVLQWRNRPRRLPSELDVDIGR